MARLSRRDKTESSKRLNYGVVDGVAGAWSNPQYITAPQVEFAPGTRTYYGRVAKNIRRSYRRYNAELNNND